jgi:hypothetical protein
MVAQTPLAALEFIARFPPLPALPSAAVDAIAGHITTTGARMRRAAIYTHRWPTARDLHKDVAGAF